MEISREEFDDFRARVRAQDALINAILIALRHKRALSDADLEAMFEATHAALDQVRDPIIGAVSTYVENFRIACMADD
jgi:hypothetical protein